jgi:ribosomal protein L31E
MAEKEYTIRLNNLVRIPRTRYANKVVFAVKQFARKHTHAENKDICISSDVNAAIWERGMNHKISKLNVVLRKKDRNVWVFTPNGNDLKEFEKAKTPAKKKEAKGTDKKETTKKGKEEKTENAEKSEKKESKAAESKAPATEKK